MTLRRGLIWGGGCLGGLALFLLLTLALFPAGDLAGAAQRALARQGLTLGVGGVGKAFPLGIRADRVTIASEEGTIVSAERLVCRLHLLPLLRGRVIWSAELSIGDGVLELRGRIGRQPEVTIESRNLRLERLPVVTSALGGGTVQGAFTVTGTLSGVWPMARGVLRLDATAIDLKQVTLGGIRLPDAVYRTMRGQLEAGGGKVVLKSVALDGDGIYARVQGQFPVTAPITSAPLNLTLELMPKADFMERQKLIFLVLTRFMVSPGNFTIPVKGTLGAPSIF